MATISCKKIFRFLLQIDWLMRVISLSFFIRDAFCIAVDNGDRWYETKICSTHRARLALRQKLRISPRGFRAGGQNNQFGGRWRGNRGHSAWPALRAVGDVMTTCTNTVPNNNLSIVSPIKFNTIQLNLRQAAVYVNCLLTVIFRR